MVAAFDFIFVDGVLVKIGNEEFPNAAVVMEAHGVATAVPLVEVADDADTQGAGCPDSETDSRTAVYLHDMGA